jgi:hypothetical protein
MRVAGKGLHHMSLHHVWDASYAFCVGGLKRVLDQAAEHARLGAQAAMQVGGENKGAGVWAAAAVAAEQQVPELHAPVV